MFSFPPLRLHCIRPGRYDFTRGFNLALKILDRLLQPLVNRHFRLPIDLTFGGGYVRLPLRRVIRHLGQVHDFALGPAHVANFGGEVVDGVFVRVADIDWHVVVAIHELDQSIDQIVDVLEAAGVCAISVYCDVLVLEGLDDEVRHDASIVGVHSGTEGVENTSDANFNVVLAFVGVHHSFCDALSLIVACLSDEQMRCEMRQY